MKKTTLLFALLAASSLLFGCSAKPTETLTDSINKEDPAQDDRLNILMIGNSGCYYYVEELYGMLDAAGIKANVCNVYYSGCSLKQHWTWWKNSEAHYEYFTTNENGRVKTEGCTLEYCLAQQDWDIISLQEGGMAALRSVSTDDAIQQRDLYLKELFGHLREQFPQAALYWHQASAYQVGYNRNFLVESLADQKKDTQCYRDFAIAISKRYQVDWIPRGDAAQLVREAGYDQLCARLGIGENNGGDFYHDGDWGGGQYLTAGVWFEVITGQSIIGNSYRPVYNHMNQEYTLSQELIDLLQESAHQAASQRKSEGQ